MSTLHLGPGSEQPPKLEGKLRLYSMQYCPFAQKSRLVLLAKNLPHDIVNINLKDKPDWFLKLNPKGQVPVLDTGSEILTESGVICDYLDAKYPNPALYPKTEAQKAEDRELIGKSDKLGGALFECVSKFSSKTPEQWVEVFTPLLMEMQDELAARGTRFFGGDKPGMVDYFLWPWAERAPVVEMMYGVVLPFNVNLDIWKKWKKDMKIDPACKTTLADLEKHKKIFESVIGNLRIDYDNL